MLRKWWHALDRKLAPTPTGHHFVLARAAQRRHSEGVGSNKRRRSPAAGHFSSQEASRLRKLVAIAKEHGGPDALIAKRREAGKSLSMRAIVDEGSQRRPYVANLMLASVGELRELVRSVELRIAELESGADADPK